MKIRFNLFIVSSLIVTLAVLFSTLMFLAQMRSEVLQRVRIEQDQALRTFWQLLLDKGNDFRIVDGKLLAGSYVVNGNYELPDKVKDIFGGTATIFMGDTRVSTNVLTADGHRAVGTRLVGPAYDAVFKQNRSYRGEAPILGIPYFTAYDPLRDHSGRIIGILYVGVKKSDFLAGYHHLTIEVIAGSIMLEIMLVAFAWGLLRERVQAEARVGEIANRLRLITDSVPVGIAYVDTKMRYIFANSRYEELFGMPGKELAGRMVKEVVGNAFYSTREEYIRRALDGGEIVFTHQVPRKNGSTLTLQTAYIPHLGDGKSVDGYFIQHYDITDLTLAQEALRSSEEQYRILFNTTGTAMFVSEEDTTVSLVNQEFIRLSGYAREEVEGLLSWTVFVAPESRERMLVYHRNRRIDPPSAPHTYECEVIRRDGSQRNILAHVSLIPGTSQSIVSFLDITRHKELEASLQSQLTFLQTLIDTIPSPIFYKDRDGRYTGCNTAFESYLGRTREDVVGKTVYDLAPPEMANRYKEMDDALFVNPGVQVYDASVVYADGSRHEVTFNKATFFADDGRVEGLVGVILDLTERKRAEDALRESEDRFHRIFSQNDDAIVLFRLDSLTIIDANPAAEEITGYPITELRQLTPPSLVNRDDFRKLIELIPMDDHSHVIQLQRATLSRKDGSSLSVAIRAKVLRLRDEYVIHCSIRDNTEKERLEEEVRATQAKLIHTNKMASIGMLASSVAHEINNPNNCISVNAAMMADVWHDAAPLLAKSFAEYGDFTLRGIPFSKMRDFAPRLLNGITEGSRRITSIIHNMRDYVREDKSGLHGEIDVNRLIQNAASILWHHIHMHTDNFQLALDENLPMAWGNGQQIEQVIINLIVNALQSLTDKTGGVFVTTSGDHGSGTVSIIVRDEGKGMSDAILARLREPFFSTKLAEGGTGLGLYISDSILKEHKGALTFDSCPDKGTTATVVLRQTKNSS